VPDVKTFYHIWLEMDVTAEHSFFRNVQAGGTRGSANVTLLHYAKLKADLPREMRRIADFLDIKIDEDKFPRMLLNCSIEHMKDVSADDEFLSRIFEGGGTHLRQQGHQQPLARRAESEEAALADAAAAKYLTPDCAQWLKTGELSS